MNREQIKIKIIEILNNQLSVGHVEFTTDLNENTSLMDIGFDSLDHVEVIMAIEETFNIKIDEDTQTRLQTFGDLIGIVCDELGVNDNA